MSKIQQTKMPCIVSALTTASDGYVDEYGRTDAEIYLQDVVDGKILACQKIIQLAHIMLPRIKGGYKKWHYDTKRAVRVVDFIEHFCFIPSGTKGVPFKLEAYERLIIELTFGFVDDEGHRQIQYSLVELARKNGKTSLAAAVELYMLLADGEFAPQCYNVATSKGQASLAYGATRRICKQSKYLGAHIRSGTVDERDEKGLLCDSNLGFICNLSGNGRSLDGLDSHFVLYDELAAATDRSVFDLVRQSMGARKQPLMMVITTQGFVRYNIWDTERDYACRWLEGEVEDDRFLGILFELDESDDWTDERIWQKANPGLGTVKQLDYLRKEVQKARQDPSYLPTVLTKEFNVPSNEAAAFFSFEEAVNPEVANIKDKNFRYCVVGFDLSDCIDLTAATALMMQPGDDHIYARSMYWIPEDSVRTDTGYRKERDDVPYHLWETQGLIRLTPGNKIDEQVIFDWLQELKEEGIYIHAIGYDPWHVSQPMRRQLERFVGKGRSEPVRQGVQTLSQPMKEFKADLASRRIINDHNPIDEWCRMNVAVKRDINDNIQPIKGKGAKGRIDGFMAELMAYIALQRHAESYANIIH